MLAQEAVQEWTSREMRLDPFRVPHRVEFSNQQIQYSVDRNGAVLKRKLGCGLPVSLALPNRSFKGIAARAFEKENGEIWVSLELHHHDIACCIPLLVAKHMGDIAADWHAWSRLLKLPMLLIEENDQARPIYNFLGEIMIEPPIARRKRFAFLKHRPHFLRRRKVGSVANVQRISAQEIIARR